MLFNTPQLLVPRVKRPGGFVNAEAAAYVAAITSPPSDGWKAAYDNFVGELKSASIYSITDYLRIGANVDSQAALLDVINPARSATLVGAPTFTAKAGFAGDASSKYVAENFTPSTDAVHISQDSTAFTIAIDAGDDTANSGATVAGAISAAGGTFIVPRAAGDALRGRVNQGTTQSLSGSSTTRVGLTSFTRNNGTTFDGYRNGSLVGSATQASSGLPSRQIYSGCVNNDGTAANFNDNRFGLLMFSAHLDATKQSALNTAWSNFKAAIASL